jgi:trans-aconitate methyltransferase
LNITKDYYDKYALNWATSKTDSFFHEKQFRFFRKLLKDKASVLDIGCAYGIHVPLFFGIGKGLKYSGIDISNSMIKIAKSRYPQLNFQVKNILNYKAPKKFNAFWAGAVLMHIPIEKWPNLIKSISLNMKRGAIGYLTLPEERPNPPSEIDQRFFELFDEDKFKKIAGENGWKIVQSGFRPKSPNHAPWHWFIVKLP